MKSYCLHLLMGAAVLGTVVTVAGCKSYAHPDEQAAVYNKFAQNDLRAVIVDQDRGSGVITLTGTVGSADQKTQAARFAQQAAPGYKISNQLQVEPTGLESMMSDAVADAKMDKAIENGYKATLKKVQDLKSAAIQFSASHGTLYLQGSVANLKERQEADDLAHKVPEVHSVVDNIRVANSNS